MLFFLCDGRTSERALLRGRLLRGLNRIRIRRGPVRQIEVDVYGKVSNTPTANELREHGPPFNRSGL
jgi:hypothetical protein